MTDSSGNNAIQKAALAVSALVVAALTIVCLALWAFPFFIIGVIVLVILAAHYQ